MLKEATSGKAELQLDICYFWRATVDLPATALIAPGMKLKHTHTHNYTHFLVPKVGELKHTHTHTHTHTQTHTHRHRHRHRHTKREQKKTVSSFNAELLLVVSGHL